MATPHKILFFDIETAPMLAHVWRPKVDYVPHGQLIDDTYMLTWSAKWIDSDKILSDRLTEKEAKKQDDSRIALSLADLIREADLVVAHNIKKFDIPKVNARLIYHRLESLGPVREFDTMVSWRQTFGTAYASLDYIGRFLGLGRKIKTDFDLWLRCVMGDVTALKEMERYNKQDVVLLEQVFQAMKPYVKRFPRLYDGGEYNEHVCPGCGGTEFQKRGRHRTQASTFQQVMCKDKTCGRYSRYRTANKGNKIEFYPL